MITINPDMIKREERCPFFWQGFGVGKMIQVGYTWINYIIAEYLRAKYPKS